MRIGYFLSCEEFGPPDLVEQVRMAQRANLDRLWISDHYHPWNDEQGQSPFVWSVIGAIAVMPEPELVERFRAAGGGGKLVQGGTKVCFGPDAEECVKTVHRLWPNEGLPGELAQLLPTPAHFEQAAGLVTEEMIAESVPCGPDTDKIVAAFQEYADAGYDELYVSQIGPRQSEFFDLLSRELLPRFS